MGQLDVALHAKFKNPKRGLWKTGSSQVTEAPNVLKRTTALTEKKSKLLRLVQGKHGEYDRERSRREVEASGL